MGKARDLRFGALVLDETCLFARRDGETIQFTKNERALLLAFTRNPRRIMRRSRLLDEIASSESGSSDRNIDFLVNRLRIKLGDNAKSPMYIATQYGEGYVWIASAPPADSIAAASSAAPVNAFLAILPALGPLEHRFSQQATSLIAQLRDMIADGIGAHRKVFIAENGPPAATDRLRYLLQVSFHAENRRLNCAPPCEKAIEAHREGVRSASRHRGAASFASEAVRVSKGVIERCGRHSPIPRRASARRSTHRPRCACKTPQAFSRYQIRSGCKRRAIARQA